MARKVQNLLYGIIVPVICALGPPRAEAQIVSYDGVVLPENGAGAPWTRVGTNDATRWFDNGLFCQFVTNPNNFGQFDGYKRTLGEFAGLPSFFLTWRAATDCPDSDIDGTVAGAVLASNGPSDFHFTITRDEVRFLRDNPLGLALYVNVQPDVLHTYYLALHSDLSYAWYIDGVVVNSAQYPAPYPTTDARLTWWAGYYAHDHTTKWDYVRYGVIPADHSGDFDNNGVVHSTDAYFFVDCLLAPDYDAGGPSCRWADMNADGKADGSDIQLFVNAMMGS